jgi:hypothetical protein
MIVKVMIGLAALLSTMLVVAATKPKTFRIQRSTSIDAPPESVFVLIDDLHNWARWAPQDKEDASMKRTYNESEHGAGAQWLPESRHKAARAAAGAPDFFERYGEVFDPQLGMGDVEVWIPVIE